MRVFLLPAGEGRIVFYSEDVDPSPTVPQGWFARTVRKAYQKLQDMEKKVGPRMRRLLTRLQRQTFPDELLIRRLRSAATLEIHHPSSLSKPTTQELWLTYLASRRRRHLWWMVVDLLVGIVTIVLAPLPGPNIIQYWFLYRFFCHVHARSGLASATRRVEETEFLASSILDPPASGNDPPWFAAIATHFGFTELDTFLARSNLNPAREPTESCAS